MDLNAVLRALLVTATLYSTRIKSWRQETHSTQFVRILLVLCYCITLHL